MLIRCLWEDIDNHIDIENKDMGVWNDADEQSTSFLTSSTYSRLRSFQSSFFDSWRFIQTLYLATAYPHHKFV